MGSSYRTPPLITHQQHNVSPSWLHRRKVVYLPLQAGAAGAFVAPTDSGPAKSLQEKYPRLGYKCYFKIDTSVFFVKKGTLLLNPKCDNAVW